MGEDGIAIEEPRGAASVAVDGEDVGRSHLEMQSVDRVATENRSKSVDIVASDRIVETEERVGATVADAAVEQSVEGRMHGEEDEGSDDAVGSVFGADGIEPRRREYRIA